MPPQAGPLSVTLFVLFRRGSMRMTPFSVASATHTFPFATTVAMGPLNWLGGEIGTVLTTRSRQGSMRETVPL